MSTKPHKTANRAIVPPHGNSRYDWEKWMNGEPHTARIGKEIKQERDVETFRCFLFAKASQVNKRNAVKGMQDRVKCITRVKKEGVWFQFVWSTHHEK